MRLPALGRARSGPVTQDAGAPRPPRTWRAALYLLTGLPLTAGAALVLVAGFAFALATLAVALLGIPVTALTLAAADLVCRAERARTALLLHAVVPGPAPAPWTRGPWRTRLRALLGPRRWWQAVAVFLLVPGHLAGFAVVVVLWSAALGLLALPLYVTFGGTVVVGAGRLEGAPTLTVCALAGASLLFVAPPLTRATATLLLAISRRLLGTDERQTLADRVDELEYRRAAAVNAAEAERRRIERDLHDGAQQRIVALTIDLARAKSRFAADDPYAARPLVEKAHTHAMTALTELRDLVRGVHPPVLTDRGLDAALSGLTSLSPVPATIDVRLERRPPMATESAAYFVAAEALANVAKHARAQAVAVTVRQTGQLLVLTVRDDGIGGADPAGPGLTGLTGRVASVGGRLTVTSPPGGPTTLTAELPCAS
ncbi:sensor domain-containing protein [Streptomyces sp. NPDC001508]|uniref:sensor histidine kinase n=1 Tax=Streptomyces sp. NPDC001508 TaxID=3154656 RepID=UPI0033296423